MECGKRWKEGPNKEKKGRKARKDSGRKGGMKEEKKREGEKKGGKKDEESF